LYGKAGGRKNYSAHSCTSILGRGSSPREQLICPFAESDESELKKILRAEFGNTDGFEILSSLKFEPVKTCSAFLALKRGNTIEKKMFSKPSQYFYISLENNSTSET
jgi:DNA primase large subunit